MSEKSENKLIHLIDMAARGNIFAATQLGEGYFKGTFGKVNYEKALKWCQYAAKKGDDRAAELIAKIEKKIKEN